MRISLVGTRTRVGRGLHTNVKAGYPNHLDYEGLTGIAGREVGVERCVEVAGNDLAEAGRVRGVGGVREGRQCWNLVRGVVTNYTTLRKRVCGVCCDHRRTRTYAGRAQ